jgi:endonuclease YncB( thermonuclease family)
VGKYGRCLGEIYTEGNDESLNTQLVKTGHAVEYFGGSR